jgi:hypothetical protein
MYLTSIRVTGLRGAEEFHATELDRVVELPTGPAGIAVADGLSLFAAALDGKRTAAIAVRLGLARRPEDVAVLEDDGFPTQLTVPDRFGVVPLLPPDGSRNVTITLDIELDPPLFGRLRALAVRDPRLVTALGAGARVMIKVGWLFTNDLVTASIAVLSVGVGETTFPITGSDRPSWLSGLLRDVGARFGRVGWDEPSEAVAQRLLTAALADDPERRSRYNTAAEQCGSQPFALGRLELVRSGDRVEATFGPKLLRARQFGPAAAEALRLIEAVVLDAPDVLVVEAAGIAQRTPELVRGWLSEHASGSAATLEQVILAPGGSIPASGALA